MFCTKCGGQIDDNATSCIHCGTATSNPAKTPPAKPLYKKWWFWLIIALVAIIIGGANKKSETPNTTETTATTATTEAPKPQGIKVSAKELWDAYEQNEIAAEKKYDGQLVEVTGIVDNIGTDILKDVYITLSTGERLHSIQCYFKENAEIDKVATLVSGQEVTIVGICKGPSLTSVIVKECSFVSISPSENSNSQTETAPESKIIEITAADLFAAYNENEVAADNNYGGKKLKITGTINDIGTDILDNVYVTLDTGETFYSVQCYFNDGDEEAKVADLKKGDTITLIGVCEGMSLNVMVKRCQIQ